MKEIILAGGCFWGLQKFFDQFPGVETETGYANGVGNCPSYQQVCSGSGHTEAIEICYPDSIELPQLLAAYFAVIDPVSVNRQGNDVGINYRTGIYSTDPKDLETARIMMQDLQKHFDKPLAVEVMPLQNFYPAEEYHQKYLDKNPGGYCHLPRNLMSGHSLPSMESVLKVYPGLKALYNND